MNASEISSPHSVTLSVPHLYPRPPAQYRYLLGRHLFLSFWEDNDREILFIAFSWAKLPRKSKRPFELLSQLFTRTKNDFFILLVAYVDFRSQTSNSV